MGLRLLNARVINGLVAGRLLQDNEALIPDILRLALNDIATYDKLPVTSFAQCGQCAAWIVAASQSAAVAVHLGPPWTLRLQDPAPMMQATATGGPNGSVRLSEELGRPENAGLDKAVGVLGSVKTKLDDSQAALGGPIGWADLIQYAAEVALQRLFLNAATRKAGGDPEKGRQLYNAFGSSAAPLLPSSAAAAEQRCVLASATPLEGAPTLPWGSFEKLLGRKDAAAADPAGRVMDWEAASVADLKAKFASLGLTGRQVHPSPLPSPCYPLVERQGRSCMRASVSLPAAPAAMALQLVVFSVFLGPDLEKTEAKLATDPELAGYVTKYQRSRKTISETDYEVDLINALTKICALNQKINFEAYTYATPTLVFNKL
eukprot:SM000006S19514  [mRNA]  locus=s6:1213116:1214661:+ [translate_table: standard]